MRAPEAVEVFEEEAVDVDLDAGERKAGGLAGLVWVRDVGDGVVGDVSAGEGVGLEAGVEVVVVVAVVADALVEGVDVAQVGQGDEEDAVEMDFIFGAGVEIVAGVEGLGRERMVFEDVWGEGCVTVDLEDCFVRGLGYCEVVGSGEDPGGLFFDAKEFYREGGYIGEKREELRLERWGGGPVDEDNFFERVDGEPG